LAQRDYRTAIAQLKAAVTLEDNLRYIEPPDWMLPTRHTLGAIYLLADQSADAERLYREDLARWPNNGWSLLGLTKALERQGKIEEADIAWMQYKAAWEHADFQPHASCQCVPVAGE
jgi:tetratricopeptide (TPR) repeat protein